MSNKSSAFTIVTTLNITSKASVSVPPPVCPITQVPVIVIVIFCSIAVFNTESVYCPSGYTPLSFISIPVTPASTVVTEID